MKQTLPWNVNGIPPEARELARAAATRDGLSVGDWLTRRILAEDEQVSAAPETQEPSASSAGQAERERDAVRDRDDLSLRLQRSEAETDSAVHRLDEAVRAMSRRLETTERSQTEAHRAMSSAASEINAAARDQAQAFSHLNQRIDRVERQSDTGALREAMRGLHQGLSRLADQFARRAGESAAQITSCANNVEDLSGKLTAARDKTAEFSQSVEERFASLSERWNQADARLAATARLEEAIAALGTRAKSSEERTQEALGRHDATADRLEQNLASLDAKVNASNASQESMQEALGQQAASGGRLEENLTSLETRMRLSEERLQDALAHHLALGNRLEENLAAFGARMNASEVRLQDALGHSGSRLEGSLASLEARMNSADERMQEALGRQFASGNRLEKTLAALEARLQSSEERVQHETFAALEAQIKSSEERVQETVGRHLVVIGRNLDNIITRLEQAERRGDAESTMQDGLQLFSQRMEAAEKKSREALGELKASLGDTAKRIEAMEETQRLAAQAPSQIPALAPTLAPTQVEAKTESMRPPPQPETLPSHFDLPPFPDAPPFPGGGYTPLGPTDNPSAIPALDAADPFATPPEPDSATAQDYLAQARRAARAAADQAANAGSGRSMAAGLSPAQGKAGRTGFPNMSRGIAAVLLGLAVLSAALLLLRSWLPGSQVVALPSDTDSHVSQAASQIPSGPPLSGVPIGPDQLPQAPPGFGDLTNFVNRFPGSSGAQETVAEPAAAPAAAPPADASPTQTAASKPRAAPTTSVAPAKPLPPPPPSPDLQRLTGKANAGDAKAALLLGLKYADGDGVEVSDPQAVRFLQKAAQAGEPLAQYRLGALYEKGRGLTADAKQAANWYAESAKRGNRKAMHNLAVAYANGAGIEKSFAEATRWFKNAAELGLLDSQFNLAVMYERGFGVPSSLVEAYKWYAIAAAQGDEESKTRIEALATQLQASEKDAADKAAKAFKPRAADAAANDPPALAQVAP
jgi:localization factor PodJL